MLTSVVPFFSVLLFREEQIRTFFSVLLFFVRGASIADSKCPYVQECTSRPYVVMCPLNFETLHHLMGVWLHPLCLTSPLPYIPSALHHPLPFPVGGLNAELVEQALEQAWENVPEPGVNRDEGNDRWGGVWDFEVRVNSFSIVEAVKEDGGQGGGGGRVKYVTLRKVLL